MSKVQKQSGKRFVITEADYIKAMRKASRELEIELHGKQCSLRKAVYKSKRDYNRREAKAICL